MNELSFSGRNPCYTIVRQAFEERQPLVFTTHSVQPVFTISDGNLGHDAYLIAPNRSNGHSYPHLAAFARNAPMHIQHQFWRAVGDAVSDHISDRPLWLSTSGLGIAWLHVRLDARPKYYTHQPYRELG